jgi:hypothetical protein
MRIYTITDNMHAMQSSYAGMERNTCDTADLGSWGRPEILVFNADKASSAVWNISVIDRWCMLVSASVDGKGLTAGIPSVLCRLAQQNWNRIEYCQCLLVSSVNARSFRWMWSDHCIPTYH